MIYVITIGIIKTNMTLMTEHNQQQPLNYKIMTWVMHIKHVLWLNMFVNAQSSQTCNSMT